MNYTARAKEKPEKGYSKVEGESLAVLSGIKSNKMYLQGTHFEVMVDHQPMVSLYNKRRAPDSMPERVSRHISKLISYDFTVSYESGKKTPSDYGSRHPPSKAKISKDDKEELGIESEEEDTEILVNHLRELNEAVTIDIIQAQSKVDKKSENL